MLTAPLLAFGFAAPWLLWGLALGTAPVIIHLLSRRKYRETQWAAMRFLQAALRKNTRRLRIEQIVLLAVRTALLVLLVLALAQPMTERLGAFFQSVQPVHRLIVLDASLSMGYEANERSLFEQARDTARAIVESAARGDAHNVARLSNIPPAAVVATPSFQLSSVIAEIEQMQLPHGRGAVLTCLHDAAALLGTVADIPRKETHILSDFQRATWGNESPDDAARLRATIRKFDDAGRLVLIDLGEARAPNVAVTGLDLLDSFVTTTRAVRFRATIRNWGLERVAERLVEFLVDGKTVEQRTVDLAPGVEGHEYFSHTFSGAGEHSVQVRVQKDALPLDDQRWLAVPVKERLRVLCINGGTGSRAMGKGTDFLELALAPSAEPGRGVGRPLDRQIEPVVVNEGELQGIDLQQFDCVFFCDVRMFTDREARMIETYLRSGGGVVWCLGEQVLADSYNRTLYRDGEGILPARLGDRRGDLERREQSFTFVPGDPPHPIVNAFQGNPDAGLETTQTFSYVQAMPPETGRAAVALRFDTGEPAIVESPVGRGRSILVTTSVDDRWGIWPLWPSFVPLIHEIVQFAVSGRWEERQRLVGEPLTAQFPTAAVDVDVMVTRPDGQVQPARVAAGESTSQFNYGETSISGVYEVNFAHPISRTALFAVNVDPKESNLTKLASEEIAQELLPGAEYEYLTSWRDENAVRADVPGPDQGGLTRWLLYAVLYLLFVEQLLAWDFRRGVRLLFPPLLLADLFARGQKVPARSHAT
jgi:hypothetical protein